MNKPTTIKLMEVIYKNKLPFKELSKFRGAILNSVPEECNLLFHNHKEDGFRYAYPLIQYKVLDGCAAIVCINEAIENIGKILSRNCEELCIGDRVEVFEVDNAKNISMEIEILEETKVYKIKNWMPLNQINYVEYNKMDRLVSKIEFLENILVGNILSFAKGVGIHINEKVECRIKDFSENNPVVYKGVKMKVFDVEFAVNLALPTHIGLGKGGSLGFGIVNL